MSKWRGLLEVTKDIEADSEEEAQQKMADQLIEELKNKLEYFNCWCTDEPTSRKDRWPENAR